MLGLKNTLSTTQLFIVSFVFSIIISYFITPFVIKLAHKIGAIDIPKDNRRVHKKPIPRLGGISIAFSFFITTILFNTMTKELTILFFALFIIIIMGVLDDIKELGAKLKLIIQIIAATIVAVFSVKIEFVANPFGDMSYVFLHYLSIPLTIFWIVGITNTVNLIDGLDGLAAGISAISSTTFAIILFKNGDYVSTLILIALIGSILGFLPFNFNPAKIFMGDTGALFLGFTLSVISVQATVKSAATLAVFIPIITLGIPILDTTFAIIRRAKNKQPIMQADKGHLHHRLLSTGLSQKQTVLILYMMSMILGLSAYFIAESGRRFAIFILLVDLILIGYVIYKFNILKKVSTPNYEKRMKQMKKMKILSVFGTRPEAIKMAPLVKKLCENSNFESKVLVTGQHRQMLDSVLEIFDIKPDFDLDIMRHGQTIEDITSKVIYGTTDIIKNHFRPDLLLVHGDTSTSFAAALGAFYEKVPVGHVEAGLRTGNIYSPYPEEMNRKLIGSIATYHFSPTETNKSNLIKENINPENIITTGNTVIDALHSVVKEDFKFETDDLKDIDFSKKIILLTCHRRENWGKPMKYIFDAINKIAKENDDIQIIYPVHMNPDIVKLANEQLTSKNIKLIKPLEYVEFANLISKSYFIMTDSGGLQEEAPSLGKPVLVLRTETERPEAVNAGTVKVVGVDTDTIYKEATKLLKEEKSYKKMANAVNPYGDGKACERIINYIIESVNN